MIGRQLGSYTITAKLGEGGMGEVYRATDSRLRRDVAIKVLPAAFTSDKERLARFEREAQILAQLHHPNIASIFGIEEGDGAPGSVLALVMELVEGPTLAERLDSGALSVADCLAIALQIAQALEEAHEKGIVHRDLKPQNVKAAVDGKVKVLDFGLAKAMDAAGSQMTAELARSPTFLNSPTLTAAGTELGVILGTAAYMAPEQARGSAIDKRVDIWAFGVVLYEMLTGIRLFAGETVSDTLAAVLTREPDFSLLPAASPPRLRAVLARCLVRDPRRRLRDIGDARLELEAAIAEPATAIPSSRRGSTIPWLVAAALAAALLGVGWLSRGQTRSAPPPLRRFAMDLPWQSVPNWSDCDVALSPTGGHLAYYGRRENDVDVYVRALDSLEAVPLADGRQAEAMAFSPDGEWLAIRDHKGVRRVSIHGGRSQEILAMARDDGDGLSWGIGGDLLIGTTSGLLRAPSAGGPAAALTRIDVAGGETGHVQPFHLPGGQHALFTINRRDRPQIAIVDLATGAYRSLALRGFQPSYSPSGHLVFRQGASVLAVRFDLASLAVSGEAVPVLEGVHRGPYLAADGSMLYVPERGDSNARLVWVDRTGRPTPILGEQLDYSHLALARDGKQALLNIGQEIYVRDLERGTRRLLASGDAWFPIWSADGRWATYRANFDGKRALLRQQVDGSGSPERLRDDGVPTSWNSRTGDLAYFDDASDIWVRSPDGTDRRVLGSPGNQRSGRFSPDGRWLAYVSDETGSFEVYLTPYPGPGPKVAISIGGGMEPIWSADGRELFFRRGGKMLAAALTFTPDLAAGRPVELFDGPYTLDLVGHQRQDVAPDGRFLMVENGADFRMVLVQNWTRDLIRLTTPGAKQ